MTTTEDNKQCVKVSVGDEGLKFMDVTLPAVCEVSITSQGVVHVNVNGQCVFRCCKARFLTLRNDQEQGETKHLVSTIP